MNYTDDINLGSMIFSDIDKDPYLIELYENILYNYSINLFELKDAIKKPINIEDALRFADILSKSTHPERSDNHKILGQEMVALLKTIEPENRAIDFYLGSVLLNNGNFRGMEMVTPDHQSNTLLDRFYAAFSKDLMRIPAEPECQFFRSQKIVYDRMDDPYFSYSAPTSMGKSFIMRMFLKKQIMDGSTSNFALLVPTKALINEVTSSIINDLKELLADNNYRLATSAGALVLKQEHNFILVLTPERLLYLLISNPDLEIDYLFVDEAHKISTKDSRSAFYYKVVDMLSHRENKPHMIFASPNIPNPEVYLKLIPNLNSEIEQKLTTTFTPVSQLKYFIDFPNGEIQLFNSYSNEFKEIASLKESTSFYNLISLIGLDKQNCICQLKIPLYSNRIFP